MPPAPADPQPDDLQPIEEQLAHLARAVEDMSDLLREQGAEIARLKRQMAQLFEREAERELSAGAGIPLADQKPPHW